MYRKRQAVPTAGFTLIELLVVIAIIAILAAILFPVFARARAKAIQSTCLSNVKQLAMAFMMYQSDNDDMYPASSANSFFWFWGIQPYIKNTQIMSCAGVNNAQGQDCANTNPANSYYGWLPYSLNYSPNDLLMYDYQIPASDSDIPNPATTILVIPTQYNGWLVGPNDLVNNASGECYPSGVTTGGVGHDHNGMLNLGFCDGHAKALKMAQTAGTAANNYTDNMWTYPNLGPHHGGIPTIINGTSDATFFGTDFLGNIPPRLQ